MRGDNDEDDVWRSIVDNYGDRPELDPDDPRSEPEAGPESPAPAAGPGPAPQERTWDDPDSDWTTDRFVPPPPPPVPTTTRDRMAAWVGVFGSPAALLFCLILGIDLPEFIAYLLVAGFVGGFLYLVFQMPRGPRDPGDDGARL